MYEKEELENLKNQRTALESQLSELSDKYLILQRKYILESQIKERKEQELKKINEKIEALQKEISKVKIYRIKPLYNGHLHIEFETEEESLTRRSITISPDHYPYNKIYFPGKSFLQAYISVCGTKLCWTNASCPPIYIDIKEIIKHHRY